MRRMPVELPSKFDFKTYYLNQAAGGPTFPIYRARQRGGFIGPLIKRHGIPFLKWLGKQAASFASGVGNKYLETGELSKDDIKAMLKKQGKAAATSVLDKVKEQVGSGYMNYRRDGRLSTILPDTSNVAGSHRRHFYPTSQTSLFHNSMSNLSSANQFKKWNPKKQSLSKSKKKSSKASPTKTRKRKATGRKKIARKTRIPKKTAKKTQKKKLSSNNNIAHTIFE